MVLQKRMIHDKIHIHSKIKSPPRGSRHIPLTTGQGIFQGKYQYFLLEIFELFIGAIK